MSATSSTASSAARFAITCGGTTATTKSSSSPFPATSSASGTWPCTRAPRRQWRRRSSARSAKQSSSSFSRRTASWRRALPPPATASSTSCACASIESGRGNPAKRVASFLAALARLNADEGRDPGIITEEFSSGAVAGHLNMSVDALAGVLRQLEAHGHRRCRRPTACASPISTRWRSSPTRPESASAVAAFTSSARALWFRERRPSWTKRAVRRRLGTAPAVPGLPAGREGILVRVDADGNELVRFRTADHDRAHGVSPRRQHAAAERRCPQQCAYVVLTPAADYHTSGPNDVQRGTLAAGTIAKTRDVERRTTIPEERHNENRKPL